MAQQRLLLRADRLGGYMVPLGLGFTAVWAVGMGLLEQVWARPVARTLWLVVIAFSLATAWRPTR